MNILEKPKKLEGILWLFFSATATFSALFLPVFIFAILKDYSLKQNIFSHIFLVLVVLSATYHGLYRVKTIASDLGLDKYQKLIKIMVTIILITVMIALFVLLYFYYFTDWSKPLYDDVQQIFDK